ncbi:MAG: 50S ribosomal protein L15 [bacterium]|nr:50S ribosomal protein L15 [bacterium]
MKNILSTLPGIVEKKKKRIGRGLGSGKGSKSGRGTTRHQKARGKIPMHFEGGQGRLVKKFPLLRGKGKNRARGIRPMIVNLEDLNVFKDNDTVTVDTLIEKKRIDSRAKEIGVKILGGGKLERKLTIMVSLSKSAKTAIEKLGGIVNVTS